MRAPLIRAQFTTARTTRVRALRLVAGGQALAEYLLVCASLVAALFLPFVDGRSVAMLLASTLVEYLRGTSFVTSIL